MENFDHKSFMNDVLISYAKHNLRKYGEITPVCFIFTGSVENPIMIQHALPPMNSVFKKNQICQLLTELMKSVNAWGYALVMETWIVVLEDTENANIENVDLIPSKHPDKKEAIFCSIRTYDIVYSISVIIIRHGGKIYYKSPIEMDGEITGRFSNLLPRNH